MDLEQSTDKALHAVAANSRAVQHKDELHAPELEYQPPVETRKKGAVIGSSAKLNPEGILAAAREAKAREEAQQRTVNPSAEQRLVYRILGWQSQE